MYNFIKGIKVFTLLSLISITTFAQDLPPEDEADTPVDGGVIALVSLAAAWGIRKIRQENK